MIQGDVKADMKRCGRCHRDHKQMVFMKFVKHPPTDSGGQTYTHWGLCPNTGEPVFVALQIKGGN